MKGSPVLTPSSSLAHRPKRASHAQLITGYVLVSIARSRLIHARYTTNVIILPKNFESMIGDADQLINMMKLRLRDEPNNTRARISLQPMQTPCASRNVTHEHTNTIMISRHEFLSITMQHPSTGVYNTATYNYAPSRRASRHFLESTFADQSNLTAQLA